MSNYAAEAASRARVETICLTHAMEQASTTRVLIVAYRTAATQLLMDAVRARAQRSPCSFTLLVPRPYWDPDTEEVALTLELSIPLLEEAAAGHVEGIVGQCDPFEAARESLARESFDEVIVST